MGQVPASGVGDVERRGSGLDDFTEDLRTVNKCTMIVGLIRLWGLQ